MIETRSMQGGDDWYCVVTIWKVVDEFMHEDDPASSDDLFMSYTLGMPSRRRTGQACCDVVAGSHIEHDA